MQAIHTYFVPCTNTKPNRIRAKCDAKSILLSWDSLESSVDSIHDVHAKAAQVLADQLGWEGKYYGKLVSGSLPNNGGFVHVFTGKEV